MALLSAFSGAQPITPGGLVELGHRALNPGSLSITQTGAARFSLMPAPVAVVCDGSPVLVEAYLSGARPDLGAGNRQLFVGLFIDGVEVFTQFGLFITPAAGDVFRPSPIAYRYTPTAGLHTFEIKASVDAGTGYIEGGSGIRPPSYLRVSKIVQQNDGLKPFWTPPIVTALPANPQFGDVVHYRHSGAGNIGAVLPMQYDGTKWLPLGEAILARWGSGGGQTFSSTTPTALNVGTYNTQTFTPPWDGWYEVTARVEHATLTTGIGMYYAFRSTDGAHNVTLNYVADANGYTYHTSFGFPNPQAALLSSAKTYRFYGWITYPYGNTGYMNFASAHIKAVAG